MSEVKKILFSVSEKGNALCKLWVDDDKTTDELDCKVIAIRSQVAYLFFLGVGSQITLKKSKQYWNVEVPDTFTSLFEGYKVSPDNTIKMIGFMLNSAFNNAFSSLSYLKNGEINVVSREECNKICSEYLTGYFNLYDNVLENLNNSKNKALKNVAKTLTSENSKPSEIKEANFIIMNYVGNVNNYLNKQHIKISEENE